MIGDTIYAVASPPGPAPRGVLRVSGPDARAAAAAALVQPLADSRATQENIAVVLGHRVPCTVLTMLAPDSYTGEDVVELHLPGSPVLLDQVCEQLQGVARPATPGEFTRRAFANGRLDLAAAEAVLDLIHAADVAESRFALDVLRGGLTAAVGDLRREIQSALALLEAGLDFEPGETGEVDPDLWLPHLHAARERCGELLASVPQTGIQGELLLLGAANAGKSSLANALVGRDQALVAPVAGTTRDVLVFELGPELRLLDAPGDLPDPAASAGSTTVDTAVGEATVGDVTAVDATAVDATAIDAAAVALRDRLAARVAGVIEVVDRSRPAVPAPARAGCYADLPVCARVRTKCDLPPGPGWDPGTVDDGVPVFAVSSVSGAGIDGLRRFLLEVAGGRGPRGLGPRLHGALGEAAAALDRVLEAVDQPGEVLAVELATALRELDRISGRSSPEDVLDRIFARFCMGK